MKRKLAALYLAFQGLLGIVWWAMAAAWPEVCDRFVPPGAPRFVFHSFWLPDLVIVVAGSLAAAYAIARARPWAPPAAWLTAGGVAYAAFYFLLLSVYSGGAWAATAVMAPTLVLTLACAISTRR